MKRPQLRVTWDVGIEQRCTQCGEWWPADADFFYTLRGRLHPHCRACVVDAARQRKQRRKAA